MLALTLPTSREASIVRCQSLVLAVVLFGGCVTPPPLRPPPPPVKKPAPKPPVLIAEYTPTAVLDRAMVSFDKKHVEGEALPRVSLEWGENWVRLLSAVATACDMKPRTSDLAGFKKARRYLEEKLESDRDLGVLLPADIDTRLRVAFVLLDESVDELNDADAPGTFQRVAKAPQALPPKPLTRGVAPKSARALAPFEIESMLAIAAAKHGVSVSLLRAMVAVESGFKPSAVSGAGAQGLMQLMPATARELGVRNSFDPQQNIDGGAKYIAQLLKKFKDEKLAVAAYNAGPARVMAARGIPNYSETQVYVQYVMGMKAAYEGIAAGSMVLRAPLDTMRVSSPFGGRRDPVTNQRHFHAGVDFEAKKGTPVFAAGSGLVVFAGAQGEEGQKIVLDHGDGVRTHYANLSKFLVRSGQTVREGDNIGLVGSTGKSTAPHLHFAVTNRGEFADPSAVIGIPFGAKTATRS